MSDWNRTIQSDEFKALTAPTVPEMKALGSSSPKNEDTHHAAAYPVLDPDAPVIVQTAQALAMNIRDVPGWEDDARLVTAHCHAVTLIEDLTAPTEKGDGVPLPDPACHLTGWSAKKIDGAWRVGMAGNLDTVHDARLTVHQHEEMDGEARRIAEWVAASYTAMIAATQQATGEGLEDALDRWIVDGLQDADRRLSALPLAETSTPEDAEAGRTAAYQVGFQNGVKSTLTDAIYIIQRATQQAVSPPEGVGEKRLVGLEIEARPLHETYAVMVEITPDGADAIRAFLAASSPQPGSDDGGSSNEGKAND